MQIMISAAQSRAARAILDLGLQEIAKQAGIAINTLSRFEKDDRGGTVSIDTAAKVAKTYQALGITFTDGDGVRRAQGEQRQAA